MEPAPILKGITYQLEPLSASIIEMLRMSKEHWEFAGSRTDIRKLNIDVDVYLTAARMGRLVIGTARDRGRLIGYLMMAIRNDIHATETMVAESAFYYVEERPIRGLILRRIIGLVLTELKRREIKFIKFHTRVHKSIGPMLELMGFRPDTVVYTLCQS